MVLLKMTYSNENLCCILIIVMMIMMMINITMPNYDFYLILIPEQNHFEFTILKYIIYFAINSLHPAFDSWIILCAELHFHKESVMHERLMSCKD